MSTSARARADWQAVPPRGTRLRTLAGLAGYRCGHSGSCCRAGWPIPVEPAPLVLLRQGLSDGSLHSQAQNALDDGHILGRTQEGSCGFLRERAAEGGCEVERRLGVQAMSASCRQFPRILLADGRGWHQTLSAWCGTAARLLVAATGPLRDFLSFDHIDCDPRVHAEALDARDAWPPLLRPGVLAGHDGYGEWESAALEACLGEVDRGSSVGAALRSLLARTKDIREWRPAAGPLPAAVEASMRRPPVQPEGTWADRDNRSYSLDHLLREVYANIPADWQPSGWPEGLTDAADESGPSLTRPAADNVLARYLATRLTGSWVAYQGQGLLSVVASLVACYALATLALAHDGAAPTIGRMTNSIRATDWLVLHLMDRQVWADWCSQAERADGVPRLLDRLDAADTALAQVPWADSDPAARS